VKYLTQQENGICFPAEKYLQNQLKVELKKRKYCEKEKNKNENREATLNISNNSPRILVAEKKQQKRNNFLPKISWIRSLTIRNVVLAPKWRIGSFL
jgi:hypothetical protein